MDGQQTKLKTVPLYAVPTSEQLEKWHSLSREEQELSVDIALSEALASEPVNDTAESIEAEILQKRGLIPDATN